MCPQLWTTLDMAKAASGNVGWAIIIEATNNHTLLLPCPILSNGKWKWRSFDCDVNYSRQTEPEPLCPLFCLNRSITELPL